MAAMNWKSLERGAKRTVTVALGRVWGAAGEDTELPRIGDLERVLVIRQQNQLGDLLLATPIFRALRAAAPEARLDLVTSPANHAAALGNRRVDEVLCYDKTRFLKRPLEGKRFADRLRDARYDLAIVSSTVSFSMTSAWLATLSGARRRAGRADPEGRGQDVAERLYHWTLPPPALRRHQSGVNLDLVEPFGASADDWRPELHLSAAEVDAGREALDAALGAPDASGTARSLRILVHPGAGKLPNRWPADRFGAVAAALEGAGHRVVAAAGLAEQGLLAEIDRGAGGRRIARLPALPVRAFAGAAQHADLLLVNDTGVLHVGAAVGARVLALFGPTDPGQWCPASPRVRWLRAPGGDLAALDVGSVRAAMAAFAAHMLDGSPPPAEPAPAPEQVP